MPANKKYLSTKGQRALKITAGFVGGYILANLLHIVVGVFLDDKAPLIMTASYSIFLFWVGFMILAFLAKNGWKIWGIYLLGSSCCYFIIHFAN
jgi:hypothetical protein